MSPSMFATLFAFAKSGPFTESSVIVKSMFGNCAAIVGQRRREQEPGRRHDVRAVA